MSYQPEHQPTLRHSPHAIPLLQRLRVPWQKRLSLIVLTLGSLLLVNTALFARIAHATPTPEPPGTPTSIPTTVLLPTVTVTPATSTPSPTNTPPRFAFAWPQHLNLAALAFGSLLVSTVFMVRTPAAKARRRDEHDG